MPLNPDRLLGMAPIETVHSYTERDTMLYALGVGVGADDPTGQEALSLAYEQNLRALPTMAVILAYPGFWLSDPQWGVDWKRLLHGETSTIIHDMLPVAADVVGLTRVEAVHDKGADKGAIVRAVREIRDAASNKMIATVRTISFLRGDGGFGGNTDAGPNPHSTPEREADIKVRMSTRPDQALLYRLSGDYNPLHADPVIARAGGFDRPILHGLCSYGIAGRGLVQALCDGQASRLRRMDVRFSAPVFPGETLLLSIWKETPGQASFSATVLERDLAVLKNGFALFDA